MRKNQQVLRLSTVDAVNANDVKVLNVRNIRNNYSYVISRILRTYYVGYM